MKDIAVLKFKAPDSCDKCLLCEVYDEIDHYCLPRKYRDDGGNVYDYLGKGRAPWCPLEIIFGGWQMEPPRITGCRASDKGVII